MYAASYSREKKMFVEPYETSSKSPQTSAFVLNAACVSFLIKLRWPKRKRKSVFNICNPSIFFIHFQANSFQAVLITDGQHTFSLFNYPENGIQWSTPTGG